MTYDEALQYLAGLQRFGARFGLETTRRFARHFGHPEDRLRFIHVAGTNGKGSTCAMLESVYRAAGLRVGLHTSPHLIRLAERVQINREPIPETDLARMIGDLREAAKSVEFEPTLFEAITIVALRHFAENGCDLVVWETGLGGRLDATNIVTPLASVITNIQFDHEKWLGNTLAQIAFEKAGIIKPFRPIITGAEPGEALGAIAKTAMDMRAPLVTVPAAEARSGELRELALPLTGEHQKRNAALAMAVAKTLKRELPVEREKILEGLLRVSWPGRLQTIEQADGGKVIVDGAHNPAGFAALRAALEEQFPGARFVFILGAMRDKNWREMCRLIAPLASEIRVVPVGGPRGAPVEWIANACHESNPAAKTTLHNSLAEAIHKSAGSQPVVVAGSLHLAGEALDLLEPSRAAGPAERRLNEWLGPTQLEWLRDEERNAH